MIEMLIYIVVLQNTRWSSNMTETVQQWVLERYFKLWNKFKDRDFSFKQAESLLKEEDLKRLSKVLEELRKANWLKVKLDENNSRIRLYSLKETNKVSEEFSGK